MRGNAELSTQDAAPRRFPRPRSIKPELDGSVPDGMQPPVALTVAQGCEQSNDERSRSD
jgi:hypothetical protein